VKRYAIVGLGSRSSMYSEALLTTHQADGLLVGYCDPNQTRMDYYNRLYASRLGTPAVPTYRPADFGRMLSEQRVDTVIVTSIDRTHHRYIVQAMHGGCDVITEKPITIDAEKCRAILDAQATTGRKLTVTFNYRYAPFNSKIKELLQGGAIGQILSIHFEWLLNTQHGADYFRRWHRDKRNSGGLMVHKATHHFDLVNWWIDSSPETVFGFGRLAFYGRANAEERGESCFYARCHGSDVAKSDPWAIHMEDDESLRGLYLNAEHEDGYIRDQSVFGDNISIEDDMGLLVRYSSGATMSYHLTAYSPCEGYRIAFNGTQGRLEAELVESSYVSGAHDDPNRPEVRDTLPDQAATGSRIVLRPHWSKPRSIEAPIVAGGHGGGDVRLLHDVFVGAGHDPLGRAAGMTDGVASILTGIAANQSFNTGAPVRVADLLAPNRLPGPR
jgi:predicted dehydrogenase